MYQNVRNERCKTYNIFLVLKCECKRMPEERIPKLVVEWIPLERRKRGRPRKTWMEGVPAAMTTRNLEPDQWRNRE
jgi:hypothetical protein